MLAGEEGRENEQETTERTEMKLKGNSVFSVSLLLDPKAPFDQALVDLR